MVRSGPQFNVAALLGLVACVAINVWLFRLSFLYGLIGLNVTKHVGVAVLCQAVGVNRKGVGADPSPALPQPHLPLDGSRGS